MSQFLQVILSLSVILICAKAAGFLATRFKQPAVLGELIVGILLGPSLLDLTHFNIVSNPAFMESIIKILGEIGILFLIFLAGLELHPRDLSNNKKVSILAGVGGVILTVGLGTSMCLLLRVSVLQSIYIGISLAATSISISAQILMELKMMRTALGTGLLGAAILDDILIILLISGVLTLVSSGTNISSLLIVAGRVLLFLVVSTLFGFFLLPRISRFIAVKSENYGLLTLVITITLLYSFASEFLGGISAITGAFIAGLMFSRTPEKSRIEAGVRPLAYGFFIPLFFVSIGLGLDLHLVKPDHLGLFVLIIVVAILGKFLGVTLGGKLAGFKWKQAMQLGSGMIPRGEVTLIAVKLGMDRGLLTEPFSTLLIGVVIFTSLAAPSLMRLLLKSESVKSDASSKEVV